MSSSSMLRRKLLDLGLKELVRATAPGAGFGTGICSCSGSSTCASIASCTCTSSGASSGSFLDTGFDEVCFSTSFLTEIAGRSQCMFV
jgi:hypothetical protein